MTLAEQLKREESKRLTVYDDKTGDPIVPGYKVEGHPTIGIGRCLDKKGLTDDESEYLFANDISEVRIGLARRIPWMTSLNEPRQAVLFGMAFQMGIDGLMLFRNSLAMAKAGEYEACAHNLLRSKWASQTPKRAYRMAEQMRTGVWQN
jgi:lysozyme